MNKLLKRKPKLHEMRDIKLGYCSNCNLHNINLIRCKVCDKKIIKRTTSRRVLIESFNVIENIG